MLDIEFIRNCAKRGMSRREAAEAVGLDYTKFKRFVRDLAGIPWPKRGKSLSCQRWQEERRGTCPGRQADHIRNLNARQHPTYTVRGVTGTIPTLAKHFGAVSKYTVHKRIRCGWDLERALTEPAAKPVPPPPRKLPANHPWRISQEAHFQRIAARKLAAH